MENFDVFQCGGPTNEAVNAALKDAAIEMKGNLGCVVLPSLYRKDEYYYAQETVDFVKFVRESNEDINISILSDGDIEVRSLHSFDIFMPVIWIAANVLLPIVINVVSNYISDKMRGRESEEATVDVAFVVNRNGENKVLTYHGPAREFMKTFKNIDLNKL